MRALIPLVQGRFLFGGYTGNYHRSVALIPLVQGRFLFNKIFSVVFTEKALIPLVQGRFLFIAAAPTQPPTTP